MPSLISHDLSAALCFFLFLFSVKIDFFVSTIFAKRYCDELKVILETGDVLDCTFMIGQDDYFGDHSPFVFC